MSSFWSMCLVSCAPQLYPTMPHALANKRQVFKYIFPLGCLFAVALYCSNAAYRYSSIAFLQFCKEGNLVIIYFMSVAVGLQTFSWTKFWALTIIIAGCSMCVNGEINFVMMGLIFQLTSEVAACSKNIIGEIIMTGAGMKLDPLTFVAFQAPCSLAPLLMGLYFSSGPHEKAFTGFQEHWMLVLASGTLAFLLNVLIAIALKRLSALSFIVVGITKDVCIVSASTIVMGEYISLWQKIGFLITVAGIATYSHIKLTEHQHAAQEKAPLLPDNEKQKPNDEEELA